MNRFALALVLLFGGDLVSSYQATPNDAVMSSIVLGGDDGAMLGSSVGEELRSMFVEWVNEFEKEYPSVEEMLERMLVWVENHARIEEHNNQEPAPSFTLAHNRFSDMTQDEFQQMHFLGDFATGIDAEKVKVQKKFSTPAVEEAERRMLRSQKTSSLADMINWVESGAVAPVKNQGHCGDCWAFSTTGAIEGARFIKTGELTPLSEQMLTDCDTKVDNGCQGGLMDNAFKYDETIKGLCSEEDYPYEAANKECRMDSCTAVPDTELKTYVDVDDQDAEALMAAVNIGPVSVAIQAGQFVFQFYHGGVFESSSCGKPLWDMCLEGDNDNCCNSENKYGKQCFPKVDHAVLVVGYGTDETTGKPYWLVKNSWGQSWGEEGYVRLSRDTTDDNLWGVCGILSISSYPILL
mmetsp:Transcript_2173/g.2845  ORF Transcript_2173/g.2845 Transcript_2173/m.2845 type:complete len:408 (-) Transcript_2173:289-1512(-)